MAASASAMFSKANRRAFCSIELPLARATAWTMSFQWPGGVAVPGPSIQNKAISVWSAVRNEFEIAPRFFVIRKSRVYCALVSEGGGGGLNCEPLSIAKGV